MSHAEAQPLSGNQPPVVPSAEPHNATRAGAEATGQVSGEPRIVVGVDGSPSSKAALRWAAHLGAQNGACIEAVTAWEVPSSYAWSEGWAYVPGAWDPQVDSEKMLTATVDEVFGSDRPVGLRTIVGQGTPAGVLLERAVGALMLVVGSRGRGAFTGLLLGSVSARCAEHGACPVLVVHGEHIPVAPA